MLLPWCYCNCQA